MTTIEAKNMLSDKEVSYMNHCIGYDAEKVYKRGSGRYFKPYRNYFLSAGPSRDIWEKLKEKGYAESGREGTYGNVYFWLNNAGLNILSAYHEVFIYSENASGNEADASRDVIQVLLADAVFCGYGCWLPSSTKSIAVRARLPYRLTVDTLHYLKDKAYVSHIYEGGCNDEGLPHCTHGWALTKKWKDEHKEEYDKAQKEEYRRIDEMLAKGREDND